MKNLTWQNPEQLFVAQELINKVKSKCCGIMGLLEPIITTHLTSGGTPIGEMGRIISGSGEDWLKQVNAACPYDLGMMGQLVSVDIHEPSKTIIYNIVVNPDVIDFKLLNANPDFKRRKLEMGAMLFVSNLSDKDIDSGISFRYNYRSKDEKDMLSYTISNKDLRRLKRTSLSQEEMDKMMIDLFLEEDKIYEEKDIYRTNFDGKSYEMIFTLDDEDEFNSIDFMSQMYGEEMSDMFLNMFNDTLFKDRIKPFIRQNIEIKIIYVNKTTGKTLEFPFSREELTKIISN